MNYVLNVLTTAFEGSINCSTPNTITSTQEDARNDFRPGRIIRKIRLPRPTPSGPAGCNIVEVKFHPETNKTISETGLISLATARYQLSSVRCLSNHFPLINFPFFTTRSLGAIIYSPIGSLLS